MASKSLHSPSVGLNTVKVVKTQYTQGAIFHRSQFSVESKGLTPRIMNESGEDFDANIIKKRVTKARHY